MRTTQTHKIPPRNPNFDTESLLGLSWTRVARDHYPHGLFATCCPTIRAQTKDIMITVPIVRDGVCMGTAIIHQSCLATFLASVPVDDQTVNRRAEEIIERFTKEAVDGR